MNFSRTRFMLKITLYNIYIIHSNLPHQEVFFNHKIPVQTPFSAKSLCRKEKTAEKNEAYLRQKIKIPELHFIFL